MLLTNKNRLIEMLSAALQGLAQEHGLGEAPTARLERPKAVDHGDVACNIAPSGSIIVSFLRLYIILILLFV